MMYFFLYVYPNYYYFGLWPTYFSKIYANTCQIFFGMTKEKQEKRKTLSIMFFFVGCSHLLANYNMGTKKKILIFGKTFSLSFTFRLLYFTILSFIYQSITYFFK